MGNRSKRCIDMRGEAIGCRLKMGETSHPPNSPLTYKKNWGLGHKIVCAVQRFAKSHKLVSDFVCLFCGKA